MARQPRAPRTERPQPARRCGRRCDPPQLRQRWLAEVSLEIPGWQPDAADWVLASGALMQFFDACRVRRAEIPCALPSRAADSVWHLWLRLDSEGLHAWQLAQFAVAIPHVEAADFDAPLDEALAQSWAAACRSENRSPMSLRLPLMFEVDRRVRVPGGYAYRCSPLGHQVVHRPIDTQGRASGPPHLHPRIAYAGFAALGLLSASEVTQCGREQAPRRSDERRDGGGGSCGTSCGSSCGGGCGGGCGG